MGWGITADVTIGARSVVSFVGSATRATSGTCALERGNIGIFDGTRLVALAYVRPAADRSIGRIAALAGGGMRIWDGDLIPRPFADLTVGQDGSALIGPVAREDPVCNRTAMVPTIYELPIDRARAALASAGWTPVPAANSDGDERVDHLVAAGVVEAEACAGTGFGFCSFGYRGKAGTLSVITIGDGPMPIVSGYQVECRRR